MFSAGYPVLLSASVDAANSAAFTAAPTLTSKSTLLDTTFIKP